MENIIRPNRGAATHTEKDIATLCKACENHLGHRSIGQFRADFEDKLSIWVDFRVKSQCAVEGGCCGSEVVYPWEQSAPAEGLAGNFCGGGQANASGVGFGCLGSHSMAAAGPISILVAVPGGKPVTEVPGLRPSKLLIIVGPELVTV